MPLAAEQTLVPIRPKPESNQYFHVPFDSNKNYVDRIQVTHLLEKKLSPYDNECGSAKRVVLFGLGGSGKTEIAVHFAQRQRHSYKAVFWVNGVDEIHMNAGYGDICRIVGKVVGDNAYNSTWEVQDWLSSHKGWLLIFDNVDDDIAIDALRQFLNVGMEGDVLITSRNPTTKAYWDGIEVSDMETHEAVNLLYNITGRQDPGEEVVREKLLRDLGPLPLAVDQASSYMLATEMSLQEYHSLFRREKSRLLNQFPSTLYNQESRETVMTTWNLSFQRIKSTHSEAAILMLILSNLSPTNITLEMLEVSSLIFTTGLQMENSKNYRKNSDGLRVIWSLRLATRCDSEKLYQLYANSRSYSTNLRAKPSSFIH